MGTGGRGGLEREKKKLCDAQGHASLGYTVCVCVSLHLLMHSALTRHPWDVVSCTRTHERHTHARTHAHTHTHTHAHTHATQVGQLITEVLDGLVANGVEGNGEVEQRVRERVRLLCQRYPIYDH